MLKRVQIHQRGYHWFRDAILVQSVPLDHIWTILASFLLCLSLNFHCIKKQDIKDCVKCCMGSYQQSYAYTILACHHRVCIYLIQLLGLLRRLYRWNMQRSMNLSLSNIWLGFQEWWWCFRMAWKRIRTNRRWAWYKLWKSHLRQSIQLSCGNSNRSDTGWYHHR